ncbi:hypothetical protein AtNW77_Chr5g0090501 [Arabidopsis thaliana]
MASALECWTTRNAAGGCADDDFVDQVLMSSEDRSESLTAPPPSDQTSSAMQSGFSVSAATSPTRSRRSRTLSTSIRVETTKMQLPEEVESSYGLL